MTRKLLILCRSLTYAQRAARTLSRAGIGAGVLRAPQGLSPSGCSYCVRISEKSLEETLRRLEKAGIPYGKIFAQTGQGHYEEVMS